MLPIFKAALLDFLCFNCLSFHFIFFPNFGDLVIFVIFTSISWSCFYMVLHVFRTYLIRGFK